MTEAEWLVCTDPQKMLEFLRGKASDRKLRLFACAFGRAVRDSEHLLGPSTVAVAERYADGLASDQDMASERRRWARTPEERGPVAPSAYDGAWEAVDWLTRGERLRVGDPDCYGPPADAVLKRSVLLLRDIIGNPFHPVHIDPALLDWKDAIVVRLAQAIYDEKAFDRLPILADALEEAGCHDTDIFGHCRAPRPHVRGCWVVDLLLGKE
jgi:hypothetical protein